MNYLMIIVIIWALIICDYLPSIIWWLFGLFELIICDYLIIIRIELFALFDDYLMIIWFPRQQQVGRQPSFPKAFEQHVLAMTTCSCGHTSACELHSMLLDIALRNYKLLSWSGIDPPRLLPLFALGICLPHVADPAVTQQPTASVIAKGVYLLGNVCTFAFPCALRDAVLRADLK